MGVIVLHYNNPIAGGGFTYTHGLNNVVLYWLESVAICAVDLFMLISGYFMVKSEKRNPWKIIELIVQVIIFNVAWYLFSVVRGHEFSIRSLCRQFIPTNYFVILYCAVFCVSPFMSFVMNRVSRKTRRSMMILMVIIFSVLPTMVDVLGFITQKSFVDLNPVGRTGDGAGYTFVNFLLCWMIGAYIRLEADSDVENEVLSKKLGSPQRWTGKKYAILYFVLLVLIYAYARLLDSLGAELEYTFSYCSPLIIAEAATAFLLFRKLKLGQNKMINCLAKGAFTVYLLHGHFMSHLGVEQFTQKNFVIMLLHVILCVTALYLICWCVYFAYDRIMRHVWGWLKSHINLPEIGFID